MDKQAEWGFDSPDEIIGGFEMSIFGSDKPNVDKMKKNRDLNGLIKALKHKNHNVRAEAVTALGELKHPMAITEILRAMGDDKAKVRVAAAYASAELTGSPLGPNDDLIKKLKKEKLGEGPLTTEDYRKATQKLEEYSQQKKRK